MHVFLTMDYELFLGKDPGSVNNCLIVPLNYLTDSLKKYNIKLSLFVDSAYLLRLIQLNHNDFDLVKAHLVKLSREGHDIQMHFHPQWLYSDFMNEGWNMDLHHYKMSDINPEHLKESFLQGKILLESIIGHKVNAFRAGGYSLQSLDDYPHFLYNNGIVLDSSVLSYAASQTKYQVYDYRVLPSKSLYRFSDSINKQTNDGLLNELPISTMKISGMSYLLKKRNLMTSGAVSKKWGDGKSVSTTFSIGKSLLIKIQKLFGQTIIPATMDGIMSACLEEVYCSYKDENQFVIIGHPKLITPSSVSNLIDFIDKIHKKVVFTTVSTYCS